MHLSFRRRLFLAMIVAIANLLIYLQVVLFYQEKNHRLYWHLALLSLLPIGVVKVGGSFRKGDVVALRDASGRRGRNLPLPLIEMR